MRSVVGVGRSVGSYFAHVPLGGRPSRRPLRKRGLLRTSGKLPDHRNIYPLSLRRRHLFRRRLEGCPLGRQLNLRSSPKRVGDNASGTFEPLRFPQTRRLKPRQRGAPRPPARPPRPPPQAGYCHAGRDGGAAAGRLGRHSLPRVHSLGCKLRRAAVGPETTPRFHLH